MAMAMAIATTRELSISRNLNTPDQSATPPDIAYLSLKETDLPTTSSIIRTPSVFSFMWLPVEIRLQICTHLLASSEIITILSTGKQEPPISESISFSRPSVSILQTCKRINGEATPILYSTNTFTIHLPLTHTPLTFFLGKLRWSTIPHLTNLSFIGDAHAKASFTCTGHDILSRFMNSDFKYSPIGPDEYMSHSAYSWITCQVLKAALDAFQRELKELMIPGEAYAAAMADDPAS